MPQMHTVASDYAAAPPTQCLDCCAHMLCCYLPQGSLWFNLDGDFSPIYVSILPIAAAAEPAKRCVVVAWDITTTRPGRPGRVSAGWLAVACGTQAHIHACMQSCHDHRSLQVRYVCIYIHIYMRCGNSPLPLPPPLPWYHCQHRCRAHLLWLPAALRLLGATLQQLSPGSLGTVDALLGCPLAMPDMAMFSDGRCVCGTATSHTNHTGYAPTNIHAAISYQDPPHTHTH
jgi:hypothetical protein